MKTGAAMLAILLLTVAFMECLGSVSMAGNVTYKKGSSVNDIVTVMQSYGFIAFGTLTTGGHQHMNFVANTLGSGETLNGEFNIRTHFNNPDTTTYVQHFEKLDRTIKIGHGGDTLYVGSEYAVSGDGQKKVDGYTVESATNVYADTDTEKYMDLEQLQKSFIQYSTQLAAQSTDEGVEINAGGSKISVTKNSGAAYLNLDAAFLTQLNQDATIEFPADSTSVVVINIDMKGADWNRKPLVLKVGGSDVSYHEDVYELDVNRIYYNFYDSSETDGQYTGSISMTDKGWGTILAPKASTNVGSNFCGVIVSKNITATGESHRSNAYNPVTPKGTLPDPGPDVTSTPGPVTTPTSAPHTTSTPGPITTPTSAPHTTSTPGPVTTPTSAPHTTPKTAPDTTPTAGPNVSSSSGAPGTSTASPSSSPSSATVKQTLSSDVGKLLITVRDEKTGKRVPKAKVAVKDSNGKTKIYTTDSNGQIKIPKIAVGKATITVKRVPSGYTVKTDKVKAVNVVKNKTTKETVKIGNSQSSRSTTASNTQKKSSNTSTSNTSISSASAGSDPETGDWYHTSVPITLLIFSLSGAAVLCIANRRWKERKNE